MRNEPISSFCKLGWIFRKIVTSCYDIIFIHLLCIWPVIEIREVSFLILCLVIQDFHNSLFSLIKAEYENLSEQSWLRALSHNLHPFGDFGPGKRSEPLLKKQPISGDLWPIFKNKMQTILTVTQPSGGWPIWPPLLPWKVPKRSCPRYRPPRPLTPLYIYHFLLW